MKTRTLTTQVRPRWSILCERWLALDLRCAIWLHQLAAWRWVVSALAVSSRLGNGILWYTLAGAMPFLAGSRGWVCTTQMLAIGGTNLLIYWQLKHWTGRERPYAQCGQISACVKALDRFSFPSGHTLHAVSFTWVLAHHYPAYGVLLWGFTATVAVSRVVLGLHYPSDVIVGALIGFSTAWIGMELVF